MAAKKHDPVNNPSHYTQGNIECIDALESASLEKAEGFCWGNTIKYLWRLDRKDASLQDARKAQWYLNRLVSILERKQFAVDQLIPDAVKELEALGVITKCLKPRKKKSRSKATST